MSSGDDALIISSSKFVIPRSTSLNPFVSCNSHVEIQQPTRFEIERCFPLAGGLPHYIAQIDQNTKLTKNPSKTVAPSA